MKKNKAIWLLTLAITSLFISCTKSEVDEGEVQNEERYKLIISGEKEIESILTRLSGATWAVNDQIGVTMTNEANNAVFDSYSNYRYDAIASGTTVSFKKYTGDMYVSGNKNIVAYYPYNSSYTTEINVDTNSDQPEIYYAKCAVSSSALTANLSFTPIFAKVTVRLVSGAGSSDISEFSLGIEYVYCKGKFNLITGQFTQISSNNVELKATGNSNEYSSLVMPQSAGSMLYIYGGDSNGYMDDVDLSSTQYVAAKHYIYTITLNKETAGFSATVTNRTEEPISCDTSYTASE